MKTVLGWAVFFIGVGALGYWSMEQHAPAIQDAVRTAAIAASADAEPVSITVSGRDVTLAGTISNETQKNALLERMANVDGVRMVHDNLELASAN